MRGERIRSVERIFQDNVTYNYGSINNEFFQLEYQNFPCSLSTGDIYYCFNYFYTNKH